MMALGKLRKFLPGYIAATLYRFLERDRIVPGLPEGIAFETLDRLCRQQFGHALEQVSHSRLSHWKPAGAFRLFLRTRNRQNWSLIYKDERYSTASIAALEGLTVRPGPPEFSIYQAGSRTLRHYLPQVYLSQEIVPQQHYRYLLEDIRFTHRRAAYADDLVAAGAELSALHAALRDGLPSAARRLLLRFDTHYAHSLLEYARYHLEQYIHLTQNRLAAQVLGVWPRLVRHYQPETFLRPELLQPVHGDYNRSNIHLPLRADNPLKVVDWEWAGVGLPHADYVSLLKEADAATEARVLALLYAADPRLTPGDHRRLYAWCRLQRGLLDSAFLARQQQHAPQHRQNWFQGYIQASLRDIFEAFFHLTGEQT